MNCVRAGNHCFFRDTSRVHTGATKLVTFDDGHGLACIRKSRSQRGSCLPRADDDRVVTLHCVLVGTFYVELALCGCLFGCLTLLPRGNVGGVPARPMVLWRGWFVLAMTLFRLTQKV